MSVQIKYFTVNISTLTGAGLTGDGFLDNETSASFIQPDGSNWPSDLNAANTRTRGNLRWRAVLQHLSENATIFSINNITPVGAQYNATPTAMNFTIAYDRPDYLYAYDELNPGVVLYNESAIKRWVARGLMQNIISNCPVLNPTDVQGITGTPAHYGYTVSNVTAGPLAADIAAAEAAITVQSVTSTS